MGLGIPVVIAAPAFERREFLTTLKTQILPLVESRRAPLIAAHPLTAARVTRVLPQRVKPLRGLRNGTSTALSAHWVEEGFNSGRFPTLIWVQDGEADFRLGLTRRMIAQNPKLSQRVGAYAVQLPSHSFFVVPPGTPISDANRPHWERPHLEDARSRLAWIHVLPAGVSLHSCQTNGHEHVSSRSLFLHGTRFLPLMENLLEELQIFAPLHQAVAYHMLAAFLLQTQSALETQRIPLEESIQSPLLREGGNAGGLSTPVARARRFMEENLSQKLSLHQIAAYAYVSSTHLNRLFRAELGQTPTEYLIARRLDQAYLLLESTDLAINRVAILCGFERAAYFNHVFKSKSGLTPREFRHRVR